MIGQEPPPKSAIHADGGDQRWRTAGLCLALAVITFAVFGQTLRHGFVDFDDNEYVYDNPMVARGLTLKGFIWAFTHVHSHNWHPLTWLSHMLDCQLYGLNPGGHHLTSVLLHTATVIALFLVLRQMTGALWRSAFVAAVFAIHPLRVESVAWVAERKDVLSGLFFMLTIGAYVRYARHPWSAARYGLVALLFALGLMSKPMLVTLPLVLLLLDYWPLRREESAGKLVLEKLPLLALSAASAVATFLAQAGARQSIEAIPLSLRLANALLAGRVYLDQMIYPAKLAVYYPLPRLILTGEVAMAGVLLAAISIFAWRERRKQPWLLTGWLWYLVMLLPVAGIIQVGEQAHADRYTYLPQIGLYIMLTWLAAEWQVSRVALGCLMAVVLAALMAYAWKQTGYWQNSETLWTHSLACTIDNCTVHNNLGITLCQTGKTDEGITQFQHALRLNPAFANARNNLGNALLQKSRPDEAIAQFQQVLQSNPASADARNNLGNALLQKGRPDEAIAQFQQVLQLHPAFATARNNLGNALLQKGRVDEAIAQFQQAQQLNPTSADIRNNLEKALLRKQRPNEAIAP